MKNILIYIGLVFLVLIFMNEYDIKALKSIDDKRYEKQSKIDINEDDKSSQIPAKRNLKPLTGFNEVAAYINSHGKLPDNYITKAQAKKLGWNSQKGNLAKVAPGKSIGGDIFTNREKTLPDKHGRKWYEADIDYKSGSRNEKRILFSNDGLIYKTTDHYKTFQRMY